MAIKKLIRSEDGTIVNYDELFEPYALALGHLLHDWNNLQEEFMLLFTDILHTKTRDLELFWSIWHAIPVDRFQRAMVREAARIKYGPNSYCRRNPQDLSLWKEIDWTISCADGLGRKRDDAAHAPLYLSVEAAKFYPIGTTCHPIALKNKSVDVLKKFAVYRDQISALNSFVFSLRQHLQSGQRSPLPKRPSSLNQRQNGAHKSSRRPSRPTKPKHRPQS